MALDAFVSGLAAAASLVVGAVLGIWLRPGHGAVAAVMSFGAGALLAALSFELIEPAFEHGGIVPLTLGFLGGAALFVAVNGALDPAGGFLRKASTAEVFLRRRRRAEIETILDGLSRVGVLRALPAAEVQALAPRAEPMDVPAGATVFAEGESGDALYVVVSGELEVLSGEERVATIGPGEVVGEMALVTGEERTATVRATSDASLLRIEKADFDRLVAASPPLAMAVSRLLAERLGATSARQAEAEAEARRWRAEARGAVEAHALRASPIDHRAIASERGGSAAVGIYVGLFLDAIPESLAIGALTVGAASFNLPFIAALFLSDLPEAMSSSVIMRRIGYGPLRIVLLWGGLTLLTGLGAVAGNLAFAGASPFALAVIFALAAGAMLAMLAQTAMPEAYEQGGWVVGIATVLGFLTAYLMKTLGEH
ncbi:MAG: cyclic nucleotide-binding domain-containing protein [Chloroflexi bacterium]|nr:cyclic nucleotide-binding domain-containing protein [Chloroflexota bacterium]